MVEPARKEEQMLSLLVLTGLLLQSPKSGVLPEPRQLTIEDFKIKIADLTMQVQGQAEYIQVLRTRIEELQKAQEKP